MHGERGDSGPPKYLYGRVAAVNSRPDDAFETMALFFAKNSSLRPAEGIIPGAVRGLPARAWAAR